MRDCSLPLIAKAIYAYLCSYAGNGMIAFPRREKIVHDLQINKDTFSKYLNVLVGQGYISKERTVTGNVYKVVQTVPAYTHRGNAEKVTDSGDMTDILVMENIKARGFGTVPKLLMLDKRLTAQAKAIYAYFASFAGAGTTAFPRRSTIIRELSLSPNTYYTHFNLLLEVGYLSVDNGRSSGRYTVNVYHLADSIEAAETPNNKALSEELSHGKNGSVDGSGEVDAPMPEEFSHGGELLKTCHSLEGMSEELSSGKLRPGNLRHDNFGHANIMISNKTNSSFEKEHGDNHQSSPPDEAIPSPAYTLRWVKEQIGYPFLQKEAKALEELKSMLGHFAYPKDQFFYQNTVGEILEEIPRVILRQLQTSNHDQILAVLGNGAVQQLFDDVSAHWEDIRSVKRYVEAAVNNMVREVYRT